MSLDPAKPAFLYPANTNACGGAYNPDMPPSVNEDTYCSPEPHYSIDRKRILSGIMNSIDPIMRATLGICKTPAFLNGASTSPAGVYYCAINVITDTVLNVAAGQSNLIDSNLADVNIAPLSGIVIPAGSTIYGNWKKVVLVSGVVQLMPHPFLV